MRRDRFVALAVALAFVALLAACGGGAAQPHFGLATGWHVGATRHAAWASTIPFRDCRDCVPPHQTIAALPPAGVVIQVLSIDAKTSRTDGTWPPQIRLSDITQGFEGVPQRYGACELWVQKGHVTRGIFVWFGRNHPAPAQLALANAELARFSS